MVHGNLSSVKGLDSKNEEHWVSSLVGNKVEQVFKSISIDKQIEKIEKELGLDILPAMQILEKIEKTPLPKDVSLLALPKHKSLYEVFFGEDEFIEDKSEHQMFLCEYKLTELKRCLDLSNVALRNYCASLKDLQMSSNTKEFFDKVSAKQAGDIIIVGAQHTSIRGGKKIYRESLNSNECYADTYSGLCFVLNNLDYYKSHLRPGIFFRGDFISRNTQYPKNNTCLRLKNSSMEFDDMPAEKRRDNFFPLILSDII